MLTKEKSTKKEKIDSENNSIELFPGINPLTTSYDLKNQLRKEKKWS
jgi:hypothetical protein